MCIAFDHVIIFKLLCGFGFTYGMLTDSGLNVFRVLWPMKIISAAPVAEWIRPLIFSAVNRSSSHRCGFEPSSGHMWDKPSSAFG